MPILSFTTIVSLLAAAAQANPVKLPNAAELLSHALPIPGADDVFHPVGFDPSLINSRIFNAGIIPDFVSVTANDLAPFANASVPASHHVTSLGKRFITQPDDRYQYTNPNAYPWRIVGRLQWSNGVLCSAALIGRRHVLTAAHCIVRQGASAQFCPSYDNGPNPTFGCANVVGGVGYFYDPNKGDCAQADDWHVVIIDRNYGDGLGYFGAEAARSGEFNKAIFTTMGYPGDRDGARRPYRIDRQTIPSSPSCIGRQFTCRSDGPFFTQTDVAGGQSGSSFWHSNGNVWGVMSVSYSCGNQGGAGLASGADMVAGINYARQNFP